MERDFKEEALNDLRIAQDVNADNFSASQQIEVAKVKALLYVGDVLKSFANGTYHPQEESNKPTPPTGRMRKEGDL